MELLNQNRSYHSLATSLSRSMFLDGDHQTKEYLRSGTRLLRFSRFGMAAPICEWWMLFDPIVLENRSVIPGFGNFLESSGCRVDVNGHFLAKGDAKIGCANVASRVLLVQLNTPVYCFAGPTTPQRPDPCEPELALPGGEFRVWIPGLKANMVNPLPIPPFFIGSSEAMETPQPVTVASDSDNSVMPGGTDA